MSIKAASGTEAKEGPRPRRTTHNPLAYGWIKCALCGAPILKDYVVQWWFPPPPVGGRVSAFHDRCEKHARETKAPVRLGDELIFLPKTW